MRMILGAVLLTAACMGGTGVAIAGSTLSGAYTASMYDYEDIDTGSGFKITFDHRFEQSPIRLEASYIRTGGSDLPEFEIFDGVTTFTFHDMTLRYEGFNLSIGWVAPVSPGSRSSLWLKGGLYTGDSILKGKVTDGSTTERFEVEDNASDLSLGLGVDWMIFPDVGLRIEYESLLEMKDFAEEKGLDLLSIGLVYAFGGAVGGRIDRAADAIPPSPPAAPPPPPAAPLAVGQTVRVGRDGATLHQRDGSATRLERGTPVELVSTRTSAGYAWWWVKAGAAEGWILESEIEGQ